MREIIQTSQFKRDFKKIAASGRYKKQAIISIIEILAEDKRLPERCRDHALAGDWHEARECHVKPDLLLIYKKEKNDLVLVRLGSHSELF